jgi:hypothetical protein
MPTNFVREPEGKTLLVERGKEKIMVINNNKTFFEITGCEAMNLRDSGHDHRWAIVNVTVNVHPV